MMSEERTAVLLERFAFAFRLICALGLLAAAAMLWISRGDPVAAMPFAFGSALFGMLSIAVYSFLPGNDDDDDPDDDWPFS